MVMKIIYFQFQKPVLLLLLLVDFLSVSSAAVSSHSNSSRNLEPFYQDSQPLLDFESKADLTNALRYNKSFNLCRWQGVTCMHGRIFRLVLQNLNLRGTFPPNSLTRLDQLRVLSLQNNSLTGPLPDFSNLTNLKSLFLDHNSFSGYFPPSVSALHRIRTLDLSHNNFTGLLPVSLTNLQKLYYLRLEYNSFNGSIPPFNQTSLQIFNVSHNNLTGAVPVTPTLLHSLPSSYSGNLGLCGLIIHRECHPGSPFFNNTAPASESASASPPKPLGQMEQVNGVNLVRPVGRSEHKRIGVIFGFLSGVLVLMGSILCLLMAVKIKRREGKFLDQQGQGAVDNYTSTNENAAVLRITEETNELEEKVKQKVQGMRAGRSGSLVFCAGEPQVYTMDQLMRGSAELLGRGSLGTTYKAVLDNRLIVTVKRLDAGKFAGADMEVYERHMESVGGLRHPNLVPLRAYFQAHEERLLIYDYQPNGSLHSLIHGAKSSRAKPLHWTSCLKIAEDVAQGLSYIHQAWRLIHGNLKSSNVLLGPDFEACLTDYCLSVLATSSNEDDANTAACKAPEIRKTNRSATSKSDVYAFGVLLLEILTGKPPSQHPYLIPDELVKWVRSTREADHGGEEDSNLVMLVEIAASCSMISPEQRPTMWQVLKMLQEIKETVLAVAPDTARDSELDPGTGIA